MLILTPNQQGQSTEGKICEVLQITVQTQLSFGMKILTPLRNDCVSVRQRAYIYDACLLPRHSRIH